jgi:hypothetical protein
MQSFPSYSHPVGQHTYTTFESPATSWPSPQQSNAVSSLPDKCCPGRQQATNRPSFEKANPVCGGLHSKDTVKLPRPGLDRIEICVACGPTVWPGSSSATSTLPWMSGRKAAEARREACRPRKQSKPGQQLLIRMLLKMGPGVHSCLAVCLVKGRCGFPSL